MSADATLPRNHDLGVSRWHLDPRERSRLLPVPGATRYADHLERYGPLAGPPSDLIDAVTAAGLRGHGGAGFPTAIKLRAVANGRRRPVVVANGTEGEPASAKDKVLLMTAPHLVLDGIQVASELLGASAEWLCVDGGWPDLVASLEAALADRAAAGSRLGSCRVVGAPDGYVTGEESALVNWLNGHDANPTFTPPRPFERGVRGRPTFVSNVETFADLALIARFGPDWYRALGTSDTPGTMLVTVTGGIANPGVCEVEGGTRLADVIATAGGSPGDGSAVLLGGYFGTWIAGPDVGRVALDPPTLARFGASLGCGAIAVVPPTACPVQEVARVTRWMAGQSAGQCGPCLYGLDTIATVVERQAAGESRLAGELDRYLDLVRGRGACRMPDGVVRFVESARRVFADHYEQHLRSGPCPAQPPLLPTPAVGRWR